MSTAQTAVAPAGLGQSVALLVRWRVRSNASQFPLLFAVQIAVSVLLVLGLGMFVGNPPELFARYLTTGAGTAALLTVALIVTSQSVSQMKENGSLAWMKTWPVARTALVLAEVTMWTALVLPGLVLGWIIGAARFHVSISPRPWIILVVLVVALTATSLGYSYAVLLHPQIANVIGQLLTFVVLMFSPVSFPAERLPGWLQTIHHFLPIEPMAELMRAGVMPEAFSVTTRSVVVLTIWVVAAVGGAEASLRRRL